MRWGTDYPPDEGEPLWLACPRCGAAMRRAERTDVWNYASYHCRYCGHTHHERNLLLMIQVALTAFFLLVALAVVCLYAVSQ